MPPRAKTAVAASIDNDDSRDDLMATPAPNKRKTTTKMPAKTRGAGARRASTTKATTTKRKAAPKQSREALKDRTNLPDGNETEEVDEFDNEEDDAPAKPAAKRAKTTATTRKNANPAADKDDKPAKKTAPGAKRGRPARRVPTPEPLDTIPETQPDPEVMEDVEASIEEVNEDTMDIEKAPTPKPLLRQGQRGPSAQPLQPRPSGRAASAQPIFPPVRSRSGSATGLERRGGDPEFRRQLNDISKKYENLQLKYEGLQEIGKGAEANFEKLKRASDQKAKDAADLIASLRKEVAEMKKASTSNNSETTDLQTQISTLTASTEKLAKERDELKEKHRTSHNEIKALEAKLIAARQQISNSAADAKAQELAAKKAGPIASSIADSAKEAKMKENLYADLTGLIISSIKRADGEDTYNCIQTGRNGSKCFPLLAPKCPLLI